MIYETTELWDRYGEAIQVAAPIFKNYGGNEQFHGPICTLRVEHDFLLIRQFLDEAGEGRVLVVDGDGYHGGALLGKNMAERAVANSWAGIIINGCIRDVAGLRTIPIGINALNSVPTRSAMEGVGAREVEVEFAGVKFKPGAHLYADADGIVISTEALPPTA